MFEVGDKVTFIKPHGVTRKPGGTVAETGLRFSRSWLGVRITNGAEYVSVQLDNGVYVNSRIDNLTKEEE